MNSTDEKNKALLMELMKLTEQEYETQVFENGCQWIEQNIHNNQMASRLLMQSKIYWIWWLNQWNRRNSILIFKMSLDTITAPICQEFRHFLISEYNETHSLAELSIYPHKKIMDETYAIMMGTLIKQEVKHA